MTHDQTAASTWDGEVGWPRPRHVTLRRHAGEVQVAACFVQADPADPLSADAARLQRCFSELDCQVCGEPVASIDRVGWVLHPAANMGGACCTRCMYLAVRVCPHLAGVPTGDYELWAVSSPRHYTWHVTDGTTLGKVVPDREHARLHTWDAFLERHRTWKSVAAGRR